jgi:coatomer protein complex subunit epsilon
MGHQRSKNHATKKRRGGSEPHCTGHTHWSFEHEHHFKLLSSNIHNDSTMDPFSAEGELLNLHNHFHQGQWQEVIDFDTSGLSAANALPARVMSLRAQIALGQAEDVIADVQGEKEPELVAVGALAELASGNESKAVKTAEKLAKDSADNAIVQVLAGTVLQAAGSSEEALALLTQHQGNRMYDANAELTVPLTFTIVEAVALIVQIHLQQNRTDLAVKEVQAARRWAQDSLLVNLAESWVGMRVVSSIDIFKARRIANS